MAAWGLAWDPRAVGLWAGAEEVRAQEGSNQTSSRGPRREEEKGRFWKGKPGRWRTGKGESGGRWRRATLRRWMSKSR